jgi:FemAB-related protein (PEP-CTERM system-associated)
VRVEIASEPGAHWDAFAQSRPEATLGHAAAWAKIIRQGYGLPTYHLIARDVAGTVAGVLALARVRTWRGRSELVSLPFLDSSGILVRDPSARAALLDSALSLARDLGVAALELRQVAGDGTVEAARPGHRVDLVLPLEENETQQWKALSAKVRNQTRKAEREGLVLSDAPAPAALEEFYPVYCQNMRDLGSPVHSRGFFQAIHEVFGERVRFVVTRLEGRPVGGLVAIHYAGRVTVPWASTLRSERARCPNNQIYWEAIRWAIACGARELDFGRSPRGAGTHRFKLGWGARERELPWLRVSPGGEPLQDGPESEHPLLRAVSLAWQWLPVPAATFLGARLRRFLAS